MSNENNKHEILSAYFDGELTPTEQQGAEQVLEDSVAARREIDEIAELSELVKSLPAASAPAELLPAVLRQAERDMLLPIAAAPATAPKQNSRTLLTMLAGVAAAAAAIVVTIQFLPPVTSNHPEATAHLESPDNALASHPSETTKNLKYAESAIASADRDEIAANQAPGMSGSRVAAAKSPSARLPMVAKMESTEGIKGPLAGRSAGKLELDRGPAGERQAAGFSQGKGSTPPAVSSDAFSMNAQLLKNAQRGDEFQFFSTEGTKVTTYMVTVVDVNKALDKLEILLAKNEIRTQSADGKAKDISEQAKPGEADALADRSNAARDKDDERPPTRMIAVYVETTSAQFNSAMRAIYDEDMLADLHVKPPVDESQIEVADLGQSRRRLFSRVEFAKSGEKKRAPQIEIAEAKPAAATPADTPTPAAEPLQRKTKKTAPADAPTADDKAAAKNRPAKENSRSSENKTGSPPKQENRDKADRRIAAENLATKIRDHEKRAATPSFQLRVQLAPLPTAATRQQTVERETPDKRRIKPQAIASTTPQAVARNHRKLQRPTDGSEPVRILFVLRKAPGKDAPQP